ncbi:MAG: hypothetical protein SNJ77_05055 [Cytophagales bacterium]
MHYKLLHTILLAISLFNSVSSFAQDSITTDSKLKKTTWIESEIDQLPELFKNFTIGGQFRSIYYHRNIQNYLIEGSGAKQVHSMGDFYREPLVMLYLGGQINSKISVGTDLYIGNEFFNIDPNRSTDGDSLSLNLGVNFSGQIQTEQGTFGLTAGGIIWHSLSAFTMGAYQNNYNRFSIFERNPWEPVKKGAVKYRTFFNEGKIMQDSRWAKQAFQGVLLEGFQISKTASFSLLYGKTINNGGAGSFVQRYLPNSCLGFKLGNDFSIGTISFNSFNNKTVIDSIKLNTTAFQVHSLEHQLEWKGWKFMGEWGLGNYRGENFTTDFSTAFQQKITTPQILTLIPLEFGFFRIGKNLVNINSNVLNTTILEANTNFSGNAPGSMFPSASPITEIGQYTNNRQGFELNTEIDLGSVKIGLGNSISSEIEQSGKSISYSHRVNALAMSRIYNFSWMPVQYGYHNNYSSFFRGYYQTLDITDTTADGRALFLKHFNTFEAHVKARTVFLGKPLYANYLGSINTVGSKLQLAPISTPGSYLNLQYHESEAFWALHRKFTACFYLGLQTAKGGNKTEKGDILSNDSFLPNHQITTAWGLGADWYWSENLACFVRGRWMDQHNNTFSNDHYKGFELTIEIKALF